MAFISSLVSAVVMWLVIWLMTRRGEFVSLKPVLLICLVVCGATFLGLRFFDVWGIGLVLIGLVFALMQWCFLSLPKAILVSGIWLVTQIGFGKLVSPIF
ncbi:MAG: hypothetical protein P1U89_14315 [Verrucomicrobiales bacterium]|nr:hypothetical protein [Verrucomicrobiales bacterium]